MLPGSSWFQPCTTHVLVAMHARAEDALCDDMDDMDENIENILDRDIHTHSLCECEVHDLFVAPVCGERPNI